MKNFSFKPKHTVIKTLKEPPVPKKKFNWQRWIWIGIIGYMFYAVAAHVYSSVAIVFGEGQVELGKQAVTFTNDIQVLNIMVAEGDTVLRGDTLFYYKNEIDHENSGNVAINLNDPVDWIEREKLSIQKQMALKKIEKNSLDSKLRFENKELKRQRELVLLGVNNIESTLTQIENNILNLESQRRSLAKEIQYLKRHLGQLSSQEKEFQSIEMGKFAQLNTTQFYIAKTNGIIGQINFTENEVCYEKQDVMTIHQPTKISIKAYFDPDEIPYVHRGDRVEISFPDGSKSEGIIHNFYVSTYALPAEFQKKYEPVERNVVVDILPTNELEAGRWSNFYKMEVEVTKERFSVGSRQLAVRSQF